MKNKKGKSNFSVGTVLAIFLFFALIILFFGGGFSTLLDISKVLKKIPAFVWVILILLFLFRGRGGKKR